MKPWIFLASSSNFSFSRKSMTSSQEIKNANLNSKPQTRKT